MNEALIFSESGTAQLLGVLRELDCLLEQALGLENLEPSTVPSDLLRGLQISWSDAQRALGRDPGVPRFNSGAVSFPNSVQSSSLEELSTIFSLSTFDLGVVAIALAPEVDLRYQRLYAFLQDDVTRKHPTVDLILNLLCSSPAEKLGRRDHFSPKGALLRQGIVHLMSDHADPNPPLLAHCVVLDKRITRFLLGPRSVSLQQTHSALGQRHDLPHGNGDEELPEENFRPPQSFIAVGCGPSRSGLEAVARKVQPKQTWDDLVLPQDVIDQLKEFCDRVTNADRVFRVWGFDQKLSQGKGTSALFAGPSGTGKSMAAEVLANELKRDLYKIDLAAVLSKYIGEMEKNLDRIFSAAEGGDAILLFDEADALFGRRSQVRDSHDRYANVETCYLLQRMEAFEGISILATNLSQNMDEAFVRRLAFSIRFQFPSETARSRIWRGIWPAGIPLADDLDFHSVATCFKLSGGNIKNAALAAAFMAAGDGTPVGMSHVLRGIEREFQKLGKAVGFETLMAEVREFRHSIAMS